MRDYSYVYRFKDMALGMFVHFGLFTDIGRDCWNKLHYQVSDEKYEKLADTFKVDKGWAKNLVKVAKSAGARYITLTTRHHEGFSLYDTKGLSDFDVMHSPVGRDLVLEFVTACREGGVVPFFYHTLVDWHNHDYVNDFDRYVDYLISSVEILCTNYGEIGGLWFDGTWDKPADTNWQFDRLYSTIRKYQPNAMIINNTGVLDLGSVGHPEIDSVTFERGKPVRVSTDRPLAGEMCMPLHDHWGFAKHDYNYQNMSHYFRTILNSRLAGANLLLNVGPMSRGRVKTIDQGIMQVIGEWIKLNKNFIYKAGPCDLTAEGADILYDGEHYYAIVENIPMKYHPAISPRDPDPVVKILTDKKVKRVRTLDDGTRIKVKKNTFNVPKFEEGISTDIRIVRFDLED